MARLKDKLYKRNKSIAQRKFGYKNVMEIPKLEKIVVNMGLGDGKDNPKIVKAATRKLALITGQAPVTMRAKISCKLQAESKA